MLADRWVLAVAGTHGKTTTTAMLAWILEHARLEPGFLIGGAPVDFPVSARLTDSAFFVIEADEYDTAFFDKRSKFVHYRPRTAVLNNLEYDHADIFPDLAAIETQFHHLVRMVPPARPHRRQRQRRGARARARPRVLERGRALRARRGAGHRSGLDDRDRRHDPARRRAAGHARSSSQLGRHNQLNALAALAAARHVGVPVAHGLAALATFNGVKRRMETRGAVRGITVYDDFAHHPTAIAATLAALRRNVGSARIVAVLEPRSNTMKLGAMKDALPGSLRAADRVFCYAANLGWDVAGALAPLGAKATVLVDLPALVAAIAGEAQPGDHVLVMSNGGFGGIHEKLLARLNA